MRTRKKVLTIIGSPRAISSNLRFVQKLAQLSAGKFDVVIFDGLSSLPHFNPDFDSDLPPKQILEFRQQVEEQTV